MQIFKSRWFAKFARKERISDATLRAAIERAEQGFIDVDYGGGVLKQRIARPNEGKSGGYRAIILCRRGERAFFVYGFAKNERDNIDKNEERDFKELAKILHALSDAELVKLVDDKKYEEIKNYAQSEKI